MLTGVYGIYQDGGGQEGIFEEPLLTGLLSGKVRSPKLAQMW